MKLIKQLLYLLIPVIVACNQPRKSVVIHDTIKIIQVDTTEVPAIKEQPGLTMTISPALVSWCSAWEFWIPDNSAVFKLGNAVEGYTIAIKDGDNPVFFISTSKPELDKYLKLAKYKMRMREKILVQ